MLDEKVQEVLDMLKEYDKNTTTTVEDTSGCLHYVCSECKGTGVRKGGGVCFHMLSCPCIRCNFH